MKSTARETAAIRSLADALLEFLVAHQEGSASRCPPRPRQEVAVRVEHSSPPPVAAPESSSGESENRLLNARQAAEYLGIGERLMWSITAPRGPLPSVRIGRLVRYSVADLEAAVQSMRVKPRKESR